MPNFSTVTIACVALPSRTSAPENRARHRHHRHQSRRLQRSQTALLRRGSAKMPTSSRSRPSSTTARGTSIALLRRLPSGSTLGTAPTTSRKSCSRWQGAHPLVLQLLGVAAICTSARGLRRQAKGSATKIQEVRGTRTATVHGSIQPQRCDNNPTTTQKSIINPPLIILKENMVLPKSLRINQSSN